VVIHVQDQVLTHDSQSDQSNISFAHVSFLSFSSISKCIKH